MFVSAEYVEFFKGKKNYSDIFEWMLQNGKGLTAMEYFADGDWRELGYDEYEQYIYGTANNIADAISSDEEFVGLQIENSKNFGIVFWAMLMAGKCPVLLDARLSEEKTAYLLQKCGAASVIGTRNISGVNSKLADELIEKRDKFEVRWANSVALCTSGTTANSKVFVHTGEQMIHQIICLEGLIRESDRWGRADVVEKSLAFVPMHHILGFVAVFLLNSVTGGTIVFPETISPESISSACKQRGITQLIGVPMFWNAIARTIDRKMKLQGDAQYEAFKKLIDASIMCKKTGQPLPVQAEEMLKMIRLQALGDNLHLACSGGGYILPETLKLINALGYYLVNGYGITETGILSVVNSEDISLRLSGSVGTPLNGVSFEVEKNTGEILVYAPFIHTGIMDGGRIEQVNYDENKKFATGDIAHIENGYVYIDGRIKDIILGSSGENIYPDEIEINFEGMSGVRRMVALGLKKGLYDEVVLMIEPDEDFSEGSVAESIRDINGRLPIELRVQSAYISETPLPMSSSMKVRRQWLKGEIEKGAWAYRELPLAENDDNEIENRKSVVRNVSKSSIELGVCKMLALLLMIPEEGVKPKSKLVEELGIDSLQSLDVLLEVEELYGISLGREEYYSCMTPRALAELIYGKLKGESPKLKKKKKVKPITTFENSIEYKNYIQRQAKLMGGIALYGNPYFIEHDSALKDVSNMSGKSVINFGSYNYLCFSGDEDVNQAAIDAINKYGTSASGSRLLAGEKPLHKELERKIAEWKHTEDALVLVGGHSTNVTFVGNFCNDKDLIVYDALSHNSIMQGIKLSKSDSRAFPHNDVDALEKILKKVRNQYEKVLIVVEGVYSMDGDIAPIPEIVRIKNLYKCFLMVDEAHSACVIGETGGGVDEYFGLNPYDIDIKMGTLSKGLGACGGYLAGKHSLIDYLRYNIPGFVFSVGLSPVLAGAVVKAIDLMKADNTRVKKLHENIEIFMREAARHGFDTCLAGETAITPIMIGSDEIAFKLSMIMQEDGIFVPPAIYPAVPLGKARLRYCLNSNHSEEQIVYALDVLAKRMKEILKKK